LRVEGVALTAQPPVTAVSAQHLDHADAASAHRGGQAGAVGAGALDGEDQPLGAQPDGPVQQLLVAAGVGRERPGIEATADGIERDRDVDVLVGVDADDYSTPPRIAVHACHSDSSSDQGEGCATLAGRVDGTVTGPAAIRLL
jgi:hypothetical protein